MKASAKEIDLLQEYALAIQKLIEQLEEVTDEGSVRKVFYQLEDVYSGKGADALMARFEQMRLKISSDVEGLNDLKGKLSSLLEEREMLSQQQRSS